MGKKILFLFFSFLTTAALLYYVFSQPGILSWNRLITRFNPLYAWAYLTLYGVALFLRTWRYRLLIRTSSQQIKVPFGGLTLVTAVRNMLVDFLPARVGGLSYPVLLNRVVGVDLSHCLTSFTYAFIFDLISLGPLLGLAVLWDSLTTAPRYPWLWALSGFILAVGLLVLMFLEPMTKGLTHWSEGWNKSSAPAKSAWKKNLTIRLREISHSFYTLKKSGIFWPLLGLSLLIRVIKYSLLYLMLTAVIEALLGQNLHLPFLMIIFGLMGSELAASLPISGLAGIGFYESILGATLTGIGIPPAQGVSLALAMHVLTQVVDYSLGSAALACLFYLWLVRKKKIIV
jgi:uncharacterized membrane protein YbhN (UPF0104 family)